MSDLKVIIINSTIDDAPDPENKIGWVTEFSRLLGILIQKLLGVKLEVIKLSEYDIEPDTFRYFPAIVIPVLSKNFFKSPLLSGYLDVIQKEISRNRSAGSGSEILLTLKSKINPGDIPAALSHAKHFYFFKIDAVTDYITEFKPVHEGESENIFWLKIYDIVYVIKSIFMSRGSAIRQAEDLVSSMSLKSVYLAQVGLDLENQRESVLREIIRNGYKVFPEEKLPDNIALLEQKVREDLSRCSISVHLVGEDAGRLVKDRGLPLVEIENQLASEHSQRVNEIDDIRKPPRFQRIIWLSDNMETLSVKQKLFIENLKREFANIKNTEILSLPVEELKNYIINRLDESNKPALDGGYRPNKDRKLIYIICDVAAYNSCKPISDLLEESGFDVVFSNFEGEFLKIRDQHNQHLLNCDGTIIYSVNSDINWVKSKILDRLKALGMGRENTRNPTAIVLDSNKILDDSLSIQKDDLILMKEGDITRESIQPFISQVEQSNGN